MVRALIFDGHLRLTEDYPKPSPIPAEAVVQVRLAGICATDLEIIRGYMGFQGVLGHEFVGVVERCEDSSLVGQRVVGEINCYCGTCGTCRSGRVTHCPHRTTLGIWGRDGAFADYCALPRNNLHVVPESVTDEQAVFAEPPAAAIEIVEQIHLRPTQSVLVLGDGKLGLLVAQVLRLTGCELLAVGHHADRLAILQRLGIATQRASQGLQAQVDVVVDCTGNPEGFEHARKLVKPRGTLVLKSTFKEQNEVDLTSLVVDEITLVGSRCGPFGPALRLLEMGLVDVESLITVVYSLDQALDAVERARERRSLKVLLRP